MRVIGYLTFWAIAIGYGCGLIWRNRDNYRASVKSTVGTVEKYINAHKQLSERE